MKEKRKKPKHKNKKKTSRVGAVCRPLRTRHVSSRVGEDVDWSPISRDRRHLSKPERSKP